MAANMSKGTTTAKKALSELINLSLTVFNLYFVKKDMPKCIPSPREIKMAGSSNIP